MFFEVEANLYYHHLEVVPKMLFPAEPERDLPTKMERILRISAELMYSGHSGTENAKKQSYSTYLQLS